MPIRYRCPGCGQTLSISSRMAGQTFPCPACGVDTSVPDADASGAEPPPMVFKTLDEADIPPDEAPPAEELWDRLQEAREKSESPRPIEFGDAEVDPVSNVEEEPVEIESKPSPLPLQGFTRSSIPVAKDTDPPGVSTGPFDTPVPGPVEEARVADPGGLKMRRRKSESDEMDLTPMVDMTFLLLIFFMITASFVLQKTLEMPPPSPEEKGAAQTLFTEEDLEKNSVMVRITDENAILVDDAPVSTRAELADALRSGMTADRNEVVVMPAPETLHESIVSVIDAANEVGMQKIRLAGQRMEE